jgi:hypothetical protein
MAPNDRNQDVDNPGTANLGDEQSPDIVGPTGEESPDVAHDEPDVVGGPDSLEEDEDEGR